MLGFAFFLQSLLFLIDIFFAGDCVLFYDYVWAVFLTVDHPGLASLATPPRGGGEKSRKLKLIYAWYNVKVIIHFLYD